MKFSPASVVVFDIGNVLLHWDPRLLYRSMFADETKMEWFLANVCSEQFNRELDRGQLFSEAVKSLTTRYPEYAAEILAYDERWLETTLGPIEDNVAILRELRRNGTPTYAITNFSAEKFAVARQAFAFLCEFDGIVLSGEERLLKPEPEIYHVLLDRYGLMAADCLFIDDAICNVEGARLVGMHAHRFKDADTLRSELVSQGLLPVDEVAE